MKMNATLLALCLALAAVPAMAQSDVYDNGPVNGQVDAWTINFGFAVSDSFHLSSETSVNEISFYAWLEPGDTLSSVELQIGAAPFGNELEDVNVNLTQGSCFSNNFGFNVCHEMGNWLDEQAPAGNYWLTLSNAVSAEGNPVYWDENSGVGCTSPGCPSSAQENTLGTIPSEAFTLGSSGTTTTTTTSSTSTPEPSSIMLFGSGILGLAGILRRKLF